METTHLKKEGLQIPTLSKIWKTYNSEVLHFSDIHSFWIGLKVPGSEYHTSGLMWSPLCGSKSVILNGKISYKKYALFKCIEALFV